MNCTSWWTSPQTTTWKVISKWSQSAQFQAISRDSVKILLRTDLPYQTQVPQCPASQLYEAASVMDSQMLDTAHGQIHVLTCGPSDGEANGTVAAVLKFCHW